MTRLLVAAAVAGIALALPLASPASARVMYAVTLTGSVQAQLVDRESLEAPEDCSNGDATAVRRFSASAQLRSQPGPVPLGAHSGLVFRARLVHPSAAASIETSGSWETKFGALDPRGICTFVPSSKELRCSIRPAALGGPGAALALWLDYRGSEVSYTGRRLVSCGGMGEATESATLMPYFEESGGYRVGLRRAAFDQLRVGESISASGSDSHHWGDGSHLTGTDKLTYRIRVKRVR